MKHYILTLLILFGCASNKPQSDSGDDMEGFSDPYMEDSDSDGVIDFIEIEYDSVVEYMDESLVVEESRMIYDREASYSEIYLPNPIEADTSTTETEEVTFNTGLISYAHPEELIFGESNKFTVRITKSKDSTIIITAIQSDHIVEAIHAIRVNKVMTASLTTPNENVNIIPITESQQLVEDGHTYTEWSWHVVPNTIGEVKFTLNINIVTSSDIGAVTKSIEVFEKDLSVQSTYSKLISYFILTHWEYLISTIIIPFIVFLWKRRKKEKEGCQ